MKILFFFKYIYSLCYYSCPTFPLLFYCPSPCTPLTSIPTPLPQFMSMGCTYKFFGFSISYTILNLRLSILYLQFMLLILCTFPHSPPPIPPLITLHVISISVNLFLFQLFAQFIFVFVFLGSVDSCLLSFYCSYFLSSFSQINPFKISYNKDLVMMNSFNLTLSEKHFICPSILNESFAGYSNLGCRSLAFMTWNTSCQPLFAYKVSFEKSADSLMGTPLQVTVSIPLAAFKILSSLILANVIMMCLAVCFLGPTSLGLSELPGLPESLFPLPDWRSFPSLFVQISLQFFTIVLRLLEPL